MVKNKPKLIIEQYFKNNCIHIMVRIDSKTQVKYLLKFFRRFIAKENNMKILKIDFNYVFKFEKTSFGCNRITDKNVIVDYLTIDEGKKAKTAFIYVVVNSTKEYFKKINSYWAEDYFEL